MASSAGLVLMSSGVEAEKEVRRKNCPNFSPKFVRLAPLIFGIFPTNRSTDRRLVTVSRPVPSVKNWIVLILWHKLQQSLLDYFSLSFSSFLCFREQYTIVYSFIIINNVYIEINTEHLNTDRFRKSSIQMVDNHFVRYSDPHCIGKSN